MMEHKIYNGSAHPKWIPLYSLTHAYREAVLIKLHEMWKSGIIELTVSECRSPIVVVPKTICNYMWTIPALELSLIVGAYNYIPNVKS